MFSEYASYCSILPINDCVFISKCSLAAKKLIQDLQDAGGETNKKEIIDLGCRYGKQFNNERAVELLSWLTY